MKIQQDSVITIQHRVSVLFFLNVFDFKLAFEMKLKYQKRTKNLEYYSLILQKGKGKQMGKQNKYDANY